MSSDLTPAQNILNEFAKIILNNTGYLPVMKENKLSISLKNVEILIKVNKEINIQTNIDTTGAELNHAQSLSKEIIQALN
jgi:hypothetical protein